MTRRPMGSLPAFLAFDLLAVGFWLLCPGCRQSCTGSYLGRQCCTRCQAVVT